MPKNNSARKNGLLRLVALAYVILLTIFIVPFLVVFFVIVAIWTIALGGILGRDMSDSRLRSIANRLWRFYWINLESALLPSGPNDARIRWTP